MTSDEIDELRKLVERDREPARDALRVLEGMRPCEVDAKGVGSAKRRRYRTPP